MNFDRRSFIKSSSLFLSGILLQGHKLLTYFAMDEKKFRAIRNNFGLYNERGGTIAWYVDGDTVAVIDSQFRDSAKNFVNHLRAKTSRRINFLFNTHHHRDHTFGNYVLKDITNKIVAQTNCPTLQIKQSKGTKDEKFVVTADITFDDEMKIKLPNETIKTKYFGPAHTGGDIGIHFENLNIVHIGDLVFNKSYPFIDNNGGGSVKGWIEVLNKVLNYYDNDTKFVFGHADKDENVFGGKSDVVDMRNYMTALYDYVEKLVKEGKTPEQIADTNTIPGIANRFERWEGARKMNLRLTAEQLIEDKT